MNQINPLINGNQYLFDNKNHPFFDMQFLIVLERYTELENHFELKFQIDDQLSYFTNRSKLIRIMLQFESGEDILMRLLYQCNRIQIQGYYYFQALDLLQNELRLIHQQIQEHIVDQQVLPPFAKCISMRLLKVAQSILNRRSSEIKMQQEKYKQVPVSIMKDYENCQSQFEKHQAINYFIQAFDCYLNIQEKFYNWNSHNDDVLNQLLLSANNETQYKQFINQRSLSNLFQFIFTLSIYQQQAILYYLAPDLNQDTSSIQLFAPKYVKLYQVITIIDKSNQLDQSHSKLIKDCLQAYLGKIEQWKLLILRHPKVMNQQECFNYLLISKLNWSDLNNSDVIIDILIKSSRYFQAYLYASQALSQYSEPKIFTYLVENLITCNCLHELFKIQLNQNEENIVKLAIQEIKGTSLHSNVNQFVDYLIKHKQINSAILLYQEFHYMFNKGKMIEQIKYIVSDIEFDYYLSKINGDQSIDQEQSDFIDRIASLSQNDIPIYEGSQYQQLIGKSIQPLSQDRVIQCQGWCRLRSF